MGVVLILFGQILHQKNQKTESFAQGVLYFLPFLTLERPFSFEVQELFIFKWCLISDYWVQKLLSLNSFQQCRDCIFDGRILIKLVRQSWNKILIICHSPWFHFSPIHRTNLLGYTWLKNCRPMVTGSRWCRCWS